MEKAKKEINVQIGMHIREARVAAHMTQDQLAEAIGMGTKNLSAVERGLVGVSVSTVEKLCRVLGISSDAIFFGTMEEGERSQMEQIEQRLRPLSEEQLCVVKGILDKVIEAFALSDGENGQDRQDKEEDCQE